MDILFWPFVSCFHASLTLLYTPRTAADVRLQAWIATVLRIITTLFVAGVVLFFLRVWWPIPLTCLLPAFFTSCFVGGLAEQLDAEIAVSMKAAEQAASVTSPRN